MPTIQSLRRSRGMTLVALALTAGISTRTLAAIELGIRTLDGDCAERLAGIFGIAPELLDTASSAPAPAAVQRNQAAALRWAALTAALIGGLLFSHASVPDRMPHANRVTTQHTLRQEHPRRPALPASQRPPPFPGRITTQHTGRRAPASRHTSPTHAGPTVPPTRTPIPAPPAPPANQAPVVAAQRTTVVLPLPQQGPFRQNVLAALAANGRALQHVVVPPGGTWSFNRAVGDPDLLDLAPINGIVGGGWCDLASYYVLALRPLLLQGSLMFTRHVDATGFGLPGLADDVAVAIWNTNGADDEQDLVVQNTSGRTIVVDATVVDGGVQVSAAYR
jgi:transcriptional regulator with XRE-family HTH domain